PELARPDSVKRRERSTQDVIAALEDMRALDRPEIGDILDDADEAGIAARVIAQRAGIDRIEIAANRARRHRPRRIGEGERQGLHQRFAPLDEEERDATRRARPKPGQLRQKLNEIVELRGRIGHWLLTNSTLRAKRSNPRLPRCRPWIASSLRSSQ